MQADDSTYAVMQSDFSQNMTYKWQNASLSTY